MEGTQANKMKPIYDLRQSEGWQSFLTKLGWNTTRFSTGFMAAWRKVGFHSIVKIQKPAQLTETDLAEIDELAGKINALFIKIEPYFGQDVTLLQNHGYVYSTFPLTPTKTIYIHLTKSEEELWQNLSKSCKYSINRARREGAKVSFHRYPKDEVVESFYSVLKSTGSRKHFYTPPVKQVLGQIDSFKENALIALVKNEKDAVTGGKLYVISGDRALYISGGTGADGLRDKSGYLLLWDSFMYLKQMGVSVLDLEGKDDPRFPSFTKAWGGFSHFKEKFGGEELEFPYPHVKYYSKVMGYINKVFGFGI